MRFVYNRIASSRSSKIIEKIRNADSLRCLSLRNAVSAAFVATFGGGLIQACSFDWDPYDPRLSGAGGAGGENPSAQASGMSSSSASSGTTSSGGGIGGTGGGGGTGGAVGSGGAGGGNGGAGGDGGAGGGVGGGATSPCGGTDVLSDNFDDGIQGIEWYWNEDQGITVTEAGGEAVVMLPANNGSNLYSSLSTKRLYDLRNNEVFVEVTQVANPATTAQTFLTIALDSGNFIEISQQGGTIFCSKRVAGASDNVGTVLYNAQAHRFWRIRDDGTTTYWETSADGQTYVVRGQLATAQLFSLSALEVSIGAQLDGGEMNPGEAHFDNLNGGGMPKGKWCTSSSFTDDFENGVIDRRWNNSYSDPGTSIQEVGGKAVLTAAENIIGYCAFGSGSSYDMTNSIIAIEVPMVVNKVPIVSTALRVAAEGYGELEIIERNGTISFEKTIGGQDTTLASILYNAVTHRWWRFRESAGMTYWETSSDGKVWQIGAMEANPVPVTALDIVLGTGAYEAVVSPGASHFDNMNLLP